MSIVIGETLLALSNVSMNYVNGTEKQVKENAKFSDQLGHADEKLDCVMPDML